MAEPIAKARLIAFSDSPVLLSENDTRKSGLILGIIDSLLDRSIVFSFDRTGHRRHARTYDPADLDRSMKGKVCLVTGANSGLGLAVVRGLAERDATVHMLCRNAERGARARSTVEEETHNSDVHLHVIDLSSLRSIREFAKRFMHPHVHVLVHNAGVLPRERELTPDGLELTVAVHLVGPFLLTKLLLPKLEDARVVWVSSGGMYAKRLDVGAMLSNEGPYDGVAAYAMTKRGQVILSELWAEKLRASGTVVNAFHPGWAATKSLEQSLPRFWRIMRHRLRTSAEGADTALWLTVTERIQGETGKFWFDRKAVPTHLFPWTRERDDERRRLWSFCEESTGSTRNPPVRERHPHDT
jgi:NAD(P)-dependent dehydrogenase (short-subunit alcohol dehydrogenase family)